MSLKDLPLENVTYFDLNNQVNIPKNNQIQLDKDQEALEAFWSKTLYLTLSSLIRYKSVLIGFLITIS
ncbi:hypothetical protein GCM10025879_09460 [Leuconostoc litchii]|nr:hypothetical protein GCM10025879_09460 [Leuconostoc litchii]